MAVLLVTAMMLLSLALTSRTADASSAAPVLGASQVAHDDCKDDKKGDDCKDNHGARQDDARGNGASNASSSQVDKNEKITICHATGSASNPYVEITISTNGLNGHEGHDGDIIPAPAAGCPSGSTDNSPSNVNNNGNNGAGGNRGGNANDHEKITICHATGSATNPYVMITISTNGLNGHEGHDGDIIPAPAAGCPGPAAGVATTTTTTSNESAVIVPAETASTSSSVTIVLAPQPQTISGVTFMTYTIPDQQSLLLLLQSLPAGTLVWHAGNSVLTAPAGSVPTSVQSELLQQFGPPMAVSQAAANIASGQAPTPAATGNAGLLGGPSGASAAMWLMLPVVLLAAAGAREAARKR